MKMITGLCAGVLAVALAAPASAMPVGKSAATESTIEKVGDRHYKKHRRDRHSHNRRHNDGPSIRLRLGNDHHHHRNKRYGHRHDRGDVEIRAR